MSEQPRYLGTVHLFFWLCSPLPFLIGQPLCIPRCISHTYLFDSSTLEACLRWRIRAVFIGLGGEKIKVRQDRGILIAVSGLQVSRQYSRGQDVVMYSFFLVLVLPLSLALDLPPSRLCPWMIWYLVKVPSLHYASVAFLQERLGSALKVNSTSLLCSHTVLAQKRVKPLLRRSIGGESKLSSKFYFPWLWNSTWLQQRSIIHGESMSKQVQIHPKEATLKCDRQRHVLETSVSFFFLFKDCVTLLLTF